MNARSYNTKIDFYISTEIDDGYGGTTPADVKVFEKWAQIRTQGAGYKFQQYGLNDFKNPVIFRVRKGNNEIKEDHFIRHRGKDFIIKGMEDEDLTGRFINLFCDEA